jgi:mannosyltransferase OCH1-like enzyme
MEWAGEVSPELIQVCAFGCDSSRGRYRELLWNDDMLDNVVE